MIPSTSSLAFGVSIGSVVLMFDGELRGGPDIQLGVEVPQVFVVFED